MGDWEKGKICGGVGINAPTFLKANPELSQINQNNR